MPPRHRQGNKSLFGKTQHPERATEFSARACSRDRGGILQMSCLPSHRPLPRGVPASTKVRLSQGTLSHRTKLPGKNWRPEPTAVDRGFEVEESGNFSCIKECSLTATLSHPAQVGCAAPSRSVCLSHFLASASRVLWHSPLNIVSANIRGFHADIGELTYRFVKRINTDIVPFSETFLDDEAPWNYARMTGYSLWIRQDRSVSGGGFALLIDAAVPYGIKK